MHMGDVKDCLEEADVEEVISAETWLENPQKSLLILEQPCIEDTGREGGKNSASLVMKISHLNMFVKQHFKVKIVEEFEEAEGVARAT
ncbi:hypothetical protein L195_g008514 [Trifolium pratense]|uniref:Uncharacterized protein n=1 Tax=Trifolium pratense TaxID=57577 RepID=A0A2K3P976_TRIPR|nr:hypothetical protein L195_g008448 [Trifolium pratense]PNY11894.1 hypothetical protein L195_g008514 [Trifolium pratense]